MKTKAITRAVSSSGLAFMPLLSMSICTFFVYSSPWTIDQEAEPVLTGSFSKGFPSPPSQHHVSLFMIFLMQDFFKNKISFFSIFL